MNILRIIGRSIFVVILFPAAIMWNNFNVRRAVREAADYIWHGR
jgi:hypothetical protein